MYTLPKLSYSYNALEPYFDEETMKNKYAEIYNYLKEFEIKLRTRE